MHKEEPCDAVSYCTSTAFPCCREDKELVDSGLDIAVCRRRGSGGSGGGRGGGRGGHDGQMVRWSDGMVVLVLVSLTVRLLGRSAALVSFGRLKTTRHRES
jgi:hypothetical protein